MQQHLNKLRRQASTKNGEGDSGSNEANGAGGKEGGEDETAKKKRKTATPRKPRATPAKGKGKAAKAKETEVADPVTPMKREREETMEESDHEGTPTLKLAGNCQTSGQSTKTLT